MFKNVSPESVGISSERVLGFFKSLEKYGYDTHSVIMARGDNIFAEAYSFDSGKDYVCFAAEYCGDSREVSAEECLLPAEGARLFGKDSFLRYYRGKKDALLRAAHGKEMGGGIAEDDRCLAGIIDKFISRESVDFERFKN